MAGEDWCGFVCPICGRYVTEWGFICNVCRSSSADKKDEVTPNVRRNLSPAKNERLQ